MNKTSRLFLLCLLASTSALHIHGARNPESDTTFSTNNWSTHQQKSYASKSILVSLSPAEIKPAGWIINQMLRDITTGNYSQLENMRKLGAPITTHSNTRGYGEFEGNFMDGVVRNAFLTDHKPWIVKAKGIADFLLENQNKSGYIGRQEPQDFSELAKSEGELWGQCCFLRGLLAYHEFSNEKKYLDAAMRSVDHMIKLFGQESNRYFIGESTMEGGARAHGLNYIEVLEKIYLLTGDEKYVDFAFRLYDDYSNSINLKNVDNQLGYLLDPNLPYLYHAPHVAEHSRLVYWLSVMSNDPTYKRAAVNSLEKFKRALSPSGGLITDTGLLESVGGRFGSADLRYEYCSLLESAISFEYAFKTYGEILLAETAENIVFNAAQAARFADGKATAYCSKDNQIEAIGTPDNYTFRYQYAACHRIACCVYNAGRILPHYVSNMWMKTADNKSLVAAFYGPSILNTQINEMSVTIEQETMYPFENEIVFTISPNKPSSFDILLRNPSWSKNTKIRSDGAAIKFEDGFIRVSKPWKKGDKIYLSFSPDIEVRVSYDNSLFVKRGALLYSLKIEEEKKATKFWENTGFIDYDIIPADIAGVKHYENYKLPLHAHVKIQSDSTLFIYRKGSNASAEFPFDTPYGKIVTTFLYLGETVKDELVPIESTLLRRTTFSEEMTH